MSIKVISNFPQKARQFRSYAKKLGDDVMRDGMFGALEIVGTTAIDKFMKQTSFSKESKDYYKTMSTGTKLRIRTGKLSRSIAGVMDFSGIKYSATIKKFIKGNASGGSGKKESIRQVTVSGNKIEGIIGSKVKYACVYGRTRVKTNKGTIQIGMIKVGDEVLTHNGLYKKVVRIFKFPVNKKTNLVTLICEWRKDKDHEITITSDHKILINREGVNKWIQAGQIINTDKLYITKKIAYNKGIWSNSLICKNCGIEFKYALKRKHCSYKCKMEIWKKNHPHIGMKRTSKSKKKMSETRIKLLKNNPKLHPNYLAGITHPTSTEKEVMKWLDSLKVDYEKQVLIGGLWVDFYIPSLNLVIEADGGYWHKDQNKDIKRDKILKENLPKDFMIIHLHFNHKESPKVLNMNPIKNVFYLKCNDSSHSLANLLTFKISNIKSIKHWNWEKSNKLKASKISFLYDIEVEDNHSYIANGIIISNSIHEFGGKAGRNLSVTIPKRPYLTPAVKESMPDIHEMFNELIHVSFKRENI